MNTSASRPLAETTNLISDLIEQSARFYLDLLSSFSNSAVISTMDQMQDRMQRQMNDLQKLAPSSLQQFASKAKAGCGCHIPPPCWAPKAIGEIVSHACPGATATIRLRISNCGATRREIKIDAAGKATGVKIDPPALTLGPMERETVAVSVAIPTDAGHGYEQEMLLWVRGCKQQYLRWTVRVTSRGGSCCHEVEVEDCPDLVHHWYDHFYCQRPCPPRRDG